MRRFEKKLRRWEFAGNLNRRVNIITKLYLKEITEKRIRNPERSLEKCKTVLK